MAYKGDSSKPFSSKQVHALESNQSTTTQHLKRMLTLAVVRR